MAIDDDRECFVQSPVIGYCRRRRTEAFVQSPVRFYSAGVCSTTRTGYGYGYGKLTQTRLAEILRLVCFLMSKRFGLERVCA
jgi:hypothetical protein